jgi:hypothetical protein
MSLRLSLEKLANVQLGPPAPPAQPARHFAKCTRRPVRTRSQRACERYSGITY